MNPWTQMWLNYFPRAAKGNEAYFEKYRLDGFEKEHYVIRSALTELECGIRGMLGLPPPGTFLFGTGRKGDLRYPQDFRSRKRCENRRIPSERAGWTAVSDGS